MAAVWMLPTNFFHHYKRKVLKVYSESMIAQSMIKIIHKIT